MHRGLTIALGTLLLVLTGWGHAAAEDFATTKEEMVQGLTKTRSFQGVQTRSMAGSQTRTIAVVKKVDDRIQEETITVPVNDPAPRVNLRVQFDYDSYALRPESFPLVAELAKALQDPQLSGKTFLIKGHTCDLGSVPYNQRLSLYRAHVVRDLLVNLYSIGPERLQPVGYGPAMPLPNTIPANREMNRRVEVQVVE